MELMLLSIIGKYWEARKKRPDECNFFPEGSDVWYCKIEVMANRPNLKCKFNNLYC